MALVQRNEKVLFMDVAKDGVLARMKNFTALGQSKNPIEYSRRYVDEAFETTTTNGFSPSIGFAFDQDSDNAVHTAFVDVFNLEKTGSDAVFPFVQVDMTKDGVAPDSKVAYKREFSIVPNSEGDSTDAYTYSGDLKVVSSVVVGEATTTDGWATASFTAS